MSTSDPDFYDAQKFSPEPDKAPTRERGCFFYGCLITGILALLLAIAIGVLTYVLYRSFTEFVELNTATAPRELPRVEVPPEQRLAIKEKVDQFKKAVDADDDTETLVLTADEINALIDENPDLKGQAYLTIEGDRIKGKLSLSLDKLSSRVFEKIGIKALRGRYFNGEIEVKGSFSDGTLRLVIESLEVNGRKLPEAVVSNLNDSVIQLSKDPDFAKEARKIDSIEVKDGKLIIKRPGKKKRTESDLPDHVLAPPDAGKPAGKPADLGAPADVATPPTPVEPAKKP
jgi:hypothetical protein